MRIVIAALAAALVWLSFAAAASAHALWLEPEATGFQLHYGEFGENLRESSPGLLDRIDPPPAARAYARLGRSGPEGRKESDVVSDHGRAPRA